MPQKEFGGGTNKLPNWYFNLSRKRAGQRQNVPTKPKATPKPPTYGPNTHLFQAPPPKPGPRTLPDTYEAMLARARVQPHVIKPMTLAPQGPYVQEHLIKPFTIAPLYPGKPTTEETGGGGGGGGGYEYGGGYSTGGQETLPETDVTWEVFDSGVQGAPSWWKAMKPSEANEASEYVAYMNMLIPYLSPEDQRSVAANLYQMNPKAFGHLSPELIGVSAPTELTTDMVRQFTGKERATSALSALSALATAMGKNQNDLGAGYRYLQSILAAQKNYGQEPGRSATSSDGMTRQQRLAYMGAIDPLLAQGKSDQLGAYGPLAQMLSQPFFSAGRLMPVSKTEDGRYIFGEPNKALY